MARLVITNIGQLVTHDPGRDSEPLWERMTVAEDVEILIDGETIAAVGDSGSLALEQGVDAMDVGGRVVTPGLVDPHTHSIFVGTREDEFEMRIGGAGYREIAEKGGGILSSVRRLREASQEEIVAHALPYLDTFIAHGTTTVEVKSGYGLTTEDELKSLRAVKILNESHPIELIPTFLGAHEVPEEYRNDRAAYVDLVINEMIPAVAEEGLAEFCDVFCEEGVFTVDEAERILIAARDRGLGLKIHAEEFAPLGGAEMAARLDAISADHLVAVSEAGMDAIGESGTIPVLLPGTTFFLGSDKYAPAAEMKRRQLPIALATDFNPGSSMTESLQFIMTLACLKLRLTPLEAFQATTYHAARAVKRETVLGSLASGMQADIVIWNAADYRQIPYHFGVNNAWRVIKRGEVVRALQA